MRARAATLLNNEKRESVVERLRRGIAEAELRPSLGEAAAGPLSRPDEDLVNRASGLANARRMRDAIVIVLALLGELDELMPDEPDRSCFHEIADLFQDVADFAALGAKAAQLAAGGGNC